MNLIKILLVLYVMPMWAFASTGVGNGGSVVDRFLRSTRQAMVRSVDVMTQAEAGSLCQELYDLTDEQKTFCRDFIIRFAQQFKAKARDEKNIPFELSKDPLYVEGPDGQKRPVDAIASFGALGKVTFHYDAIRVYTPKKMLLLLAHEFGHKIEIARQDGSTYFVSDNMQIGPFTAADGGRQLLDAVGAAFVQFAEDHYIVGPEFSIQDVFHVTREVLNERVPPVSVLPSGARLFPDRMKSVDKYVAGIGHTEDRLGAEFGNDLASSHVVRLHIHEAIGCDEKTIELAKRATRITLTKHYYARGEDAPRDEQLHEVVFPGFNPLCLENPKVPMFLNFTDENGLKLRFTLQYQYTTQTAFPAFQKGRRK